MSTSAAPMSFDAILNPVRTLSDGVPFADISAAEEVAADGTEIEWFDLWMARADFYERLGTEAIAAGHTVSGGEWLWQASSELPLRAVHVVSRPRPP